jgi:hypothetical protein
MPALIAVAIGVLLAGLGVLTGFPAWRGLAESARARRWPTATGRVVSARAARVVIAVRASTSVTRYRERELWVPELTYEYRVGERVCRGDRMGLAAPSGSTEPGAAEAVVARYPVGCAVTVYVDPADPANAVLDPAPSANTRALVAVALGLFLSALVVPIWLWA